MELNEVLLKRRSIRKFTDEITKGTQQLVCFVNGILA
jgi:hypothetical protein